MKINTDRLILSSAVSRLEYGVNIIIGELVVYYKLLVTDCKGGSYNVESMVK